MQRRDFLMTVGAASLVPGAVAAKTGWVEYVPGLVKKRLAAGETVFLDVAADWCSTCASQGRTINALMSENPAYGQAVTFVRLDWDDHRRSELVAELNIPRRSTLVVLKGDTELGRIVAGTRRADIQALMDAALSAATA
ncbi:MAG: thioredoxin family protein [Pseudomonadota bacterium]